jgi:endonuclease/exonuclease/phosphatase family metal-dependent hydrolase
VRVLTWNLFHGRADPPAGRPLLHEFAAALAGWEWDVALLQEVPPLWPPLLARACGAEHRTARTSRNALLPLRRAVASRRPDLLKSNGGGANAILVRPPLRITAHGVRRLRVLPERRLVHAVRVVGADVGAPWVGNVHGQKGEWDGGPGLVRPLADLRTAVDAVASWSAADGGCPVLLGGDLNLPREAVADGLPDGWERIAGSGPDHLAGRGLAAAADSSRPLRGSLSDHAALAVEVRRR